MDQVQRDGARACVTTLPPVQVGHPHVVCNEHGVPLVRGTHIPVHRLWMWHRRGISVDTLIKRYPSLRPGVVLDALAFGYDNVDLIDADVAREEATFPFIRK